jgi:methylenetetrahydrofolate dehydrogenase (NADP+) / methenyltetrahydrofolate cyclohydrolase
LRTALPSSKKSKVWYKYNEVMIIDGKQIAEEILTTLAAQRSRLPAQVRLGVLMSGGDAATDSFVRVKERTAAKLNVTVVRSILSEDTTTEGAVLAAIQLAKSTDGIIVQLPLPSILDVDKIVAAIPSGRDPDALNPLNSFVRPPVAEAIAEIFSRSGISMRDKNAVVIGAGRLVGAPAAKLLRSMGARVTVVTHSEGDVAILKESDVVILGAGQPGFVKPDMLKLGAVLIDAGASEASGRVVGDADPACADVCFLFTPVPGGVGPIAVAILFKNLFVLAEKAQKERTPGA